MASAGFVYILLNQSIPGCVKIGKTVRDSSIRATELSAATGVPTPFLLAYEAFFPDCDHAESYIHALLESSGVRLAKNREFFMVSSTDAINILLRAKAELGNSTEEISNNSAAHDVGSKEPWRDVFDEAMAYCFGTDEVLEDEGRAIECFKMAAKLGAGEAYFYLGRLYSGKEGLDWLRRGAEKGALSCLIELAHAYDGTSPYFKGIPQNKENALKCLHRFFNIVNPQLYDPEGERLYAALKRYIRLMSEVSPLSPQINETLQVFSSRFRQSLSKISNPTERAAKIAAVDALTSTQ